MVYTKKDPILLFGRYFTEEDLWIVKETIRRFPKLSRTELANTICENLEWFAPNGKNKIDACNKLLEKLEADDQIILPKKKKSRPRPEKKVIPSKKTDAEPEISGTVSDVAPVYLESVRSSHDIKLWNEYIERYHYLGYKKPFGAHQRYFIKSEPLKQYLGCLLFSASAWSLADRDRWIGWDKEERSQRLHLIINNSRFLIFPWVKVKNLASKALSLAVQQVPIDWQERYGFKPVLLETFVDISLYHGTCYKAANWVLLGETAGRGRMDRYNKRELNRKHIYVYPLQHNFRTLLCEEAGGLK